MAALAWMLVPCLVLSVSEYFVCDVGSSAECGIKKMGVSLGHLWSLMIEKLLQCVNVNLTGTREVRCESMAEIVEPETLRNACFIPDPRPYFVEAHSPPPVFVRERVGAIRGWQKVFYFMEYGDCSGADR